MSSTASRIVVCSVIVFVMCFAFREISGIDETKNDLRGDDESARKETLPPREKRSDKNSTNGPPTTRNMADFHKRLQGLEKKLEALLQPKYGDSWFSNYFLGRDGRNNGRGIVGPPGPPGKDGISGKAGPKGETGKPGSKGKQGAVGKTGAQGAKGETGQPGKSGKPGPQGPKGVKGQDGKSGVKYVRWGRTTCPSGADIVYKGVVGGGNYAYQGGGVNYLCLPHNPKYDKYKDGWQNSGYVYGTEYEVSTFNPFKKNLHNYEAVCVVCFVKSRGSLLMMPARNDCPAGWTEEYHGYLMTEYHNHRKQRDFICVDEDAEYVPGTKADKNGALLYPVQTQCGSLPCKPYVAGRELTCAVCTK